MRGTIRRSSSGAGYGLARLNAALPANHRSAKRFDLSLSETSSGWRLTENRAMLSRNEGSFQAHWLDGCRSISVAGSARVLKLGIDIGQTSVAKYMARRGGPPSQGWKTFLNNHADGIAAMDMFVVPTISFRLLYGLLIMGHGRRQILWFGVTSHPSAEWIANQLTEACGWEQAPRYLIRDRDRAYGEVFIRRLRSMGIRDRPTSPRSPWQNAYAERLI